jgi:hypothetical protein
LQLATKSIDATIANTTATVGVASIRAELLREMVISEAFLILLKQSEVTESSSIEVSESPSIEVSESPSIEVSESPSIEVSESPSIEASEAHSIRLSERWSADQVAESVGKKWETID